MRYPQLGRGMSIGLMVGQMALGSPLTAQDSREWTLSEPEFEVGGFTEDLDYALSELGGVVRLEDGRVVIADRGAIALKVFDSSGRFLKDVGREGQGPGEFEYIYRLSWCSPDVLTVHDVGGRVHHFDMDVSFVTSDRLLYAVIGGGTPYRRACNKAGHEVVTGWGDFQAQFREGHYPALAPVVLLRDGETVKHFGERLSSDRVGTVRADGSPGGSGPHPFGRATVVAIGGGRVFVGDGSDYRIEVYDLEGNALPAIEWSGPDLRYTRALVGELEEAALADAREESRPGLRQWFADLPELEQVPAYDQILATETGSVWVRRFVRPGEGGEEWDVFDRSNRLVGRVRLPLRSTLWQVQRDRVVYSLLDEFDVPIVRVSRIQR